MIGEEVLGIVGEKRTVDYEEEEELVFVDMEKELLFVVFDEKMYSQVKVELVIGVDKLTVCRVYEVDVWEKIC